MPKFTRVVLTFGVATLAVASVPTGCAVAEIPGEGAFAQSGAGAGSSGGGQNCISRPTKIEKVDLATLTACQCKAGGKAHCISTDKLPETLAKPLAVCQGTTGRCVPDVVIESGGESFAKCRTEGDEGRCVTLCVPKVEKYAEALTRGDGDTCQPDEKCVPCKMPDGQSSGICEVGTGELCTDAGDGLLDSGGSDGAIGIACPYTGTKMSVSQMPICAPGGRCVSEPFLETAVPDENTRNELKARLGKCSLGYCMPEDYLRHYGQYKPPPCTSFAGIEGRCFSTVFKDVGAQQELLPRDTCTELDRCIPCFNPADGAPSGACTTVSCDNSSTIPPVLRDCCWQANAMRGKCVPRDDVPERFQSRLTWHECDRNSELCIPTENVDLKGVPATCVPQPIVGVPSPTNEGVCVSRCLVFSFLESFTYQTGACRPDQICAPCYHPQDGRQTGAPGCKYPAP